MKTLRHTRAFANNVKGALEARFRLDAAGAPLFEPDDEDPELRHYTIDLRLESPIAEDIESVTYFMEDETYADPLRVSDDRDNDFTEEISSYGDLEVEVTVQVGAHVYKQRAWLSNLLQAGHEGDASPAILDAIERIKAN